MVESTKCREVAQQLRVDSVRTSAAARSGHPTSSMSAADLMAVLLAKHLRYDFDDPDNPANDHLIFSKGHASPLLYAIYKAVGAVSDEELVTYRRFGSRLQGHPTPVLPWVDVATGSLGQGLPIGVGVALAAKRLDGSPYRVWVLCGDWEMAEGSMWEALEDAAVRGLDNLCAIIDVNRLGQRGPTRSAGTSTPTPTRARAFGWHAVEVDGHDLGAIDAAYAEADHTTGRPTVIVARTVKGKGVESVEDRGRLHGKPLERSEEAIDELGAAPPALAVRRRPTRAAKPHAFAAAAATLDLPAYEVGAKVATRKAYGEALAALGGARRGWWPSTARCPTPPTPRSSATPTPSATSSVHRRAADGGHRRRPAGPGLGAVRLHLRRLLRPGLRLRAHGRGEPGPPAPGGLPRRRVHRRGRPVADGPGGPGRLPGRARQHGAVPLRRQPDRRSWWRPWPTSTASPTCAPPGAPPRCSTGPTRPSRSAAPRCCAPRTTTRSLVGPPASPCTRRSRRPTPWPPRASRRGSSTPTRSSPSTPPPCRGGPGHRAAGSLVEDHWPEGGLGDAVLEVFADTGRNGEQPGRADHADLRQTRRAPRRRRRLDADHIVDTARRLVAGAGAGAGVKPEPDHTAVPPRSRRLTAVSAPYRPVLPPPEILIARVHEKVLDGDLEAELEHREEHEHRTAEDGLGQRERRVVGAAGDGETADRRRHERRRRGIRRGHQLTRRHDERVGHGRHDEGVEARGRRQPGDLCVADVQGDRDGEQRDTGGELSDEVASGQSRQRSRHGRSSLPRTTIGRWSRRERSASARALGSGRRRAARSGTPARARPAATPAARSTHSIGSRVMSAGDRDAEEDREPSVARDDEDDAEDAARDGEAERDSGDQHVAEHAEGDADEGRGEDAAAAEEGACGDQQREDLDAGDHGELGRRRTRRGPAAARRSG